MNDHRAELERLLADGPGQTAHYSDGSSAHMWGKEDQIEWAARVTGLAALVKTEPTYSLPRGTKEAFWCPTCSERTTGTTREASWRCDYCHTDHVRRGLTQWIPKEDTAT